MTPIERDRAIRRGIDALGAEAFADQPRVTWSIKGFEHREDYSFVEVEPTRASAGWSRLKFVVLMQAGHPTVVGCYGLDESGWRLVFEGAADTPSDWKQLCS